MKKKPQCIAPWVYLDVLPDGHVVPCCSNTLDLGDLKKQSIGEIWNGEPIKKLRREMFEDTLPKTCEVCSYAHSSLKDRYNEIFSDEIGRVDEITSEDGEVSEIKFCGFDFRISNKCNFSGNVPYFWTSGRLCDFDGCDRPDFFPKNINGWFWSANQARLSPTNSTRAFHDWSFTGG